MVPTIDGRGHISTGLGSLRCLEDDWSGGVKGSRYEYDDMNMMV